MQDHLISPSSEQPESQPLLIESSLDERKQEQWTTYPNQSDYTRSTLSTGTLLLVAGATILSILAAVSFFVFTGTLDRHSAQTTVQFAPFQIQHSWGAYTPYFPVKPYIPPPSHCHITQVNIIQRHGARFPTLGAAARIVTSIIKLQSATHYTDPRLTFLTNYTYALGANDLVPFGASQSQEAGQETFQRYSCLISKTNLPFVRSSGGTRVVESATNWTLGFSVASRYAYNPVLSVILPEHLNDTLDDKMCPNAGSSVAQTHLWSSIYGAPVADRLNAQAPGASLSAEDIPNLIQLCALETVATGTLSPFCAIFTQAEFAQFEYWADLEKYYRTGYGQALGPVQGVGYINELLARLTGLPVKDNTQTNRTLDSSPLTFPLNRTLYVDFSHDNEMIAIYAALGLFKQPVPLDPTKPDPERTWITSHLTPFSGRMVTERLSCRIPGSRRTRMEANVYVRILVDDALQPLEFCGANKDGMCELDAFVESQAYARNDGEGDFEKCYA
ncbi:acid phosphatase [Phlegmacium glaucopus]|nr:acid phosphatase [Phlegmacium glaucopus]